MFFIRGQESCSFRFRYWGPWELSPDKRWQQAVPGLRAGGDRMSATGCIEARQASRPGAQAEVSGSAAEIVAPPRPATHPPFLAGGGLLEWWKQPGSLQLAAVAQASTSKAASVVVKLRRESVPSSPGWCPLPHPTSLGVHSSLHDSPPDPSGRQDLLGPRSFPPSSEPHTWRLTQRAISSGALILPPELLPLPAPSSWVTLPPRLGQGLGAGPRAGVGRNPYRPRSVSLRG